MARPSDYSPEIAETICTRLSLGESLRQVCADDGMPDKATVFRWLHRHAEFRDQYARAREALSEHWAEEIIEIADDSRGDTFVDDDGNERTNHEVVARSRLRVDSRKWLMSKLAPKKYGDKVTQEHVGEGGGPVRIERIERTIVDPENTHRSGVSAAAGTGEV